MTCNGVTLRRGGRGREREAKKIEGRREKGEEGMRRERKRESEGGMRINTLHVYVTITYHKAQYL